jgi:hypothetical protein
MVIILDGISWTKVTGEASHAIPVLASAYSGWMQRREMRSRRYLRWVGVVQFLLLLDIVFDWRWTLHDLLAGDAKAHKVYTERRPYQVIVLELLAAALLCGAAYVLFRMRRRPGAGLSVTGTLLSVGLWCEEVVSYHYADKVMYAGIGPLMVVAYLWIGLCFMTTAGIVMEARRA